MSLFFLPQGIFLFFGKPYPKPSYQVLPSPLPTAMAPKKAQVRSMATTSKAMKAMKTMKAMKDQKSASKAMQAMKTRANTTKPMKGQGVPGVQNPPILHPWNMILHCTTRGCGSWIFQRRIGQLANCQQCNQPWAISFNQGGAMMWEDLPQNTMAKNAQNTHVLQDQLKTKDAMKAMKAAKVKAMKSKKTK